MKSSVVLAVAVAVLGVSSARAQLQVAKTFNMPVRVQGDISLSDCDNTHGPQITLTGSSTLAGMTVEMIFRNNVKGTHTYTSETKADVVVVPQGGVLEIPKQPVLGGVGGNPFIWIQLIDASGNALSDEIYLGRCMQGAFKVDASLPAEVAAVADFTALDCSNNTGPYINVEGNLGFTKGVSARFIFRNNDNPVGGPHEAIRYADVSIIPAGLVLQFPKQPVLGGVGGNPLIYTLFLQGDGSAIGKEVLLGRCVQLQPGN